VIVNGLPAHVLLVHAVVVLLPLSALLVVLVASWPAVGARLGLVTTLLAVLTAALVPITTEAGEWLEQRVPRTPLVRAHTDLGDTMLPWAVALAVVAVVVYLRRMLSARQEAAPEQRRASAAGVNQRLGGTALTVALAVVALIVSAGTVVVVYQVGESGSRAAWTDRFSPTPLPRTPGRGASGG
jgi:hypothetical protein